jgi:molybdopterin molybdotransferase
MVRLAERTRTPGKLQHFVRVRLEESDDGFVAHLTGPQGSGLLSSVAAADALLMIPEGRNETNPGEMFPALVLSDDRYGPEIPY